MSVKAPRTSTVSQDDGARCQLPVAHDDEVLKFKRRMLQWPNPVEYVNNMYGCHPDDDDHEYFKVVFGR
jgi:hypothetical protein